VTRERAAGYGRSSGDRQEKSCGQQHQWAIEKAKALLLDLVAWEEDDGIPGERLDRPGLERIFVRLARQQKARQPAKVLLIFDQDRLSRATSWATGAIVDRLISFGVERLVTASRVFDLYSDTDRALFGIEQDFGKRAYVKGMSRNVSRGMARLAAAGLWMGGTPPYGYRAEGEKYNRHLVPGPAVEVEAVRELFRLAADAELGVVALAAIANARGWPVPQGCRIRGRTDWSGVTVLGILRNPAYIGMIRYGKRRQGKYHQAAEGEPIERRGLDQEKAPPLLVRGEHDPLIDRPTFEQVQAILASRRIGGGRISHGRRHPEFAFSGKLICDHCEQIMHGADRGTEGFFGYICGSWRRNSRRCSRNSVHEQELLDKVVDLLTRELSTKATLQKMRKNLEAALSGHGETLRLAVERGRDHVAKLAAQVDRGGTRLLKVSDDLMPVAEKALRRLQANLQAAQKDLAEVEAQESQTSTEEHDIEELLARFADVPRLLARASPEERARIVRLAVAQVRLRLKVKTCRTGRKQTQLVGATVTLRGSGHTTYRLPLAQGEPRRTRSQTWCRGS
jgi:DNA invertase Pin-like site-specific DNA recombinase